MTNRLLQIRYGRVSEVYHLFHLVRYKNRVYPVYANRAQSPEVQVDGARRGLGGWRLQEYNSETLRVEQMLQPLLDACAPDESCGIYRLHPDGRLERRGTRTTPFVLRPQGWTLPLLAVWLAAALGMAWLLLERFAMHGWVMSVAGQLTDAQAMRLVWWGLPALSLGYLLLCAPSLLSVLCSIAFAVSVLVLPGVWKLQIVKLNLCLAAVLLVGGWLYLTAMWSSRRLRMPGRKRSERQQALQTLALSFLVIACVCVGVVLPQLDPPAIVTAVPQPADGDAPQTAEAALAMYRKKVLPRLTEEEWAQLDMQQRADLMQQIVDYEAEWTLHCGTLPVQVGLTDSEDTLAYYNGTAITLVRDHLMNRTLENTLQSTLHELRHHYQYCVAEMLAAVEQQLPEYAQLAYFDTARRYTANIDDYVSGDEDVMGYYYQVMERDARSFAENRYEAFYQSWVAPQTVTMPAD